MLVAAKIGTKEKLYILLHWIYVVFLQTCNLNEGNM
jgi:hypothetical protein